MVGQGRKVEKNSRRPNRRCTTKSKEARRRGRLREVRCEKKNKKQKHNVPGSS